MKQTLIGIFLLAALLQGCSTNGVVDNRSSMQIAEEKAKRMAFVPLVFGEYSKEVSDLDDRVMTASGNVFATPTYINNEGGQQMILSGEGNLVDRVFNKVATVNEQ